MNLHLIPLESNYTIHQLKKTADFPLNLYQSGFFSITKTDDEISVITDSVHQFPSLNSSRGWKGFKVEGILDFSLVGILYTLTKPLKENGIPVFVVSTFNTDYVFVKQEEFEKTIEILNATENITVVTG